MQEQDKVEIAEKRSSLRRWRERDVKTSHRGEIIGAALMILVFLAIIISSYSNDAVNKSSPVSVLQKNATSFESTSAQNTIPAPAITIYSPENIIYDTSTPSLNFIAAGSNLNDVFVSVDGGLKIPVTHDGTIAKIDFSRLDPIFIDDFSGSDGGQWMDSSSWSIKNGIYITTGGSSTFGDPEWDDYIIEAKTKITSGKDVSIDFRWDGGSKHYRVQTTEPYGNLILNKMDEKGYVTLSSAKPAGIEPSGWHIWKIIAKGNKIQVFIDDVLYIDYDDSDKPYLKGKSRMRVLNATVEYDYVQVYKPLRNGQHSLTIFADNSAGKAFSNSMNFTINTTSDTVLSDMGNIFGKIGMPYAKYGFEVTLKSVIVGGVQTSVWLSARNKGIEEKPFKLSPSPVILDNMGNQYESVKVARSSEITQTTLYANATREGAIFFDRLKDGTIPVKFLFYINGDKFEFIIDQ